MFAREQGLDLCVPQLGSSHLVLVLLVTITHIRPGRTRLSNVA